MSVKLSIHRIIRLIIIPWIIILYPVNTIGSNIEQYSVLEIELKVPSSGNPFKEVTLSAEFRSINRSLICEGFYDGCGIYKIRFMADEPGEPG
jgi:hypothetical protein